MPWRSPKKILARLPCSLAKAKAAIKDLLFLHPVRAPLQILSRLRILKLLTAVGRGDTIAVVASAQVTHESRMNISHIAYLLRVMAEREDRIEARET